MRVGWECFGIVVYEMALLTQAIVEGLDRVVMRSLVQVVVGGKNGSDKVFN